MLLDAHSSQPLVQARALPAQDGHLMSQGDELEFQRGAVVAEVGAPLVEAVDATGAGDAFVAGLLAALAGRSSLPTLVELPAILAQAHGCGALATTAKGAMTALPIRIELDAFLRSASSGC